MPFCDIDTDIKPWLGIDPAETKHDVTLTILRDSIEQAVLNFTELSFETVGPVMEVYDANESDQVVLQNIPVQSVSAVYFGTNPDGTGGSLVDASSYAAELDTGLIKFQCQYTPKGRKTVRVDYTYGYASLPPDIKHAILLAVEADFRRKGSKSIGRTSRAKKDEREGFAGGAAEWDTKTGLPNEVVFKLQTYKRYEMPIQPIATRNL